jgi:V8-like Glu-specific endopeptidase
MAPRNCLVVVLAAVVAGLCCHCGDETLEDGDDENAEKSDEAASSVVGGTVTRESRGIGALLDSNNGLCTGTLIRPRIVLTATHCIDPNKPNGYTFVLDQATKRYGSDRVHNFGRWSANNEPGWRSGDIALVRLKEAVPASVAKPLGLANRWPARGATLTLFGYGCTTRGTSDGVGTKRKLSFAYDGTRAATGRQDLCPGDSGGPLIDATRGFVVGTNSGFIASLDYYGDVPAYYQQLFDKMGEWGVAN